MKIVLVYPPFASPASMPYSLANIATFLKENIRLNNLNDKIDVFDANIFFWNKETPNFKEKFKKNKTYEDKEEYIKTSKEFKKTIDNTSSEENKKILKKKYEEVKYLNEIYNEIQKRKPDCVCFSVVYSSQCFFAIALIKMLKENKIKTIIGGPKVAKIVSKEADCYLNSREELWNHLFGKKAAYSQTVPDFSLFDKKDYFLSEMVYPVKTSNTCPYKQCAFCTHYANEKYNTVSYEDIEDTIIKNNIKKVFLIDDMLLKDRLLKLSEIFKKHGVSFFCQLKPTKDWDFETLNTLYENGLKIIIWGVESANNKILEKMRKGTKISEIEQVLSDSKKAKIKNAIFIMFGFPSETKETFLETISFLKNNSKDIDLLSTSVFGLQKESYIYNNPEEFNIKNIENEKRGILDDKISYTLEGGLSEEEANILRKKYKKTLEKINKLPKEMNFFREHMLLINK